MTLVVGPSTGRALLPSSRSDVNWVLPAHILGLGKRLDLFHPLRLVSTSTLVKLNFFGLPCTANLMPFLEGNLNPVELGVFTHAAVRDGQKVKEAVAGNGVLPLCWGGGSYGDRKDLDIVMGT